MILETKYMEYQEISAHKPSDGIFFFQSWAQSKYFLHKVICLQV